MTLRRLLGTVLLVLALATTVFGVVTTLSAWNTRQSLDSAQATLAPAQTHAEALLASFVDEETGLRGYIITSQPSFLAPYGYGLRQGGVLVRQIRREVRGHPRVAASIDRVVAAAKAWLLGTVRPEVVDVYLGDTAKAVAQERTGSGKGSFDKVRAAMGTLQSQISATDAAVNAQVSDQVNQDVIESVIRWLATLVLLGAAWFVVRRFVARPLEGLATDVQTVASGNFDAPVREHGPAEFAALARDIEAMRRRLRSEGAELAQLRAALSEHSPVLDLVQAELRPSTGMGRSTVGGRLIPAEGILAGDWYDAWLLDRDRLAVALFDVSGHGPVAGLFALKVKHLLRPALSDHASN